MADRGKGSALAGLAADLGTSVAPTRGAPEPEAGPEADLFAGLDAELEQFEGQAVRPPKRQGPGRPPGSVNRTTLQLQRLLMARGYRDPAEFLAAIMSADPRQLTADLAGHGDPAIVKTADVVEVLKVQRSAAVDLMPYFHQRMPQQVEHVGDGARPLIIISDGPRGGEARQAGAAFMSVHDAADAETIEGETADFRQSGEAAPGQSHGGGSHDDT